MPHRFSFLQSQIMPFTLDPSAVSAFIQVIFIDVVLSGDNAVVIGMAVAGLPAQDRAKIITFGIIAATLLRIAFASVATTLLSIIGLTLAGGILLAWVSWKMWREIRNGAEAEESIETAASQAAPNSKTKAQAAFQIVLADVSMSLDNVLAVAGAARDHLTVLIFGLVLSIGLMAIASNYVAKMLTRFHWIAYLGLAVIVYVALDMIWRGGQEVLRASGTILG